MSELKVELTRKQQELLLRGLRFVRSSVAFEVLDPSEAVDIERRRQYAEIAEIETLLNGATAGQPASV